MTFLSKLGGIIAKVSGIFLGFEPLLEQALPKQAGVLRVVSADLSALGDIVVSAEAIGQTGGLTGAQKAQFIGGQIAQVVVKSTLVAGRKIANPAKFQMDCVALGGVIADILNDVDESATDTIVNAVHT